MGKKLTQEDFIERSIAIHGNKYDYKLVKYENAKTKIKIICKEHGVFEQLPLNHLYQHKGCQKCSNNVKKTKKEFIEDCLKIHGDKYNYSIVNYNGNKTKVEIICPEHGSFFQIASNHMNGADCPKCVGGVLQTQEEFIKKAIITHKYDYSYTYVKYKNNHTKIEIICPYHGSFWQRPNDHLSGKGCPKCKSIISKPEIELQDFIKSLGFKIKTNNRKILNGKELDIYIPELKKAIEFNGTYWHYHPDNFMAGKHSTKSKLCKSLNINLLHLREDLWNRNKEKMKKVIYKFLNYE